MMKVVQIPVLSDNYIFLLVNEQQQSAGVVDPAEAEPVLNYLQQNHLTLTAIFNTHHHGDHVGGNRQLKQHFPDIIVYGGEFDRTRIPEQTVFLRQGDRVSFFDRIADVFFLPGHTSGHIAYYFPPCENSDIGELFCGDTLFSGGCGRLFEGTPKEMLSSLSQLRNLPDRTRVWCAHEYTLSNLRFALTVDPHNQRLQIYHREAISARQQNQPTIPVWLGTEKQINPFLRWDDPAIQQSMELTDPLRVFTRLRGKKDLF